MDSKYLFHKAAVFTDIHFGLHGNSVRHNEECINFLKWFIEIAKDNNCETCIFCGDWHHHRDTINIQTMDYTLQGLRLLNDAFETVYLILGNHDLVFRDDREINSIKFAELFPNIVLVKNRLDKGDVTLLPWLIGDEYKSIKKIKSKYIFGHLELPSFFMNARVQMPENKTLSKKDFIHQDYVFSGHFHMRQIKDNIVYIGNAFPHNYADAWDTARGMMIIEWDGEPQFFDYNGPKYVSMSLSKLLDSPESFFDDKIFAKIRVDFRVDHDTLAFIKKHLSDLFNVIEMTYDFSENFDDDDVDNNDSKENFESIDEIVVKELSKIESEKFSTKKLIELYHKI